MPIAGLTDRSRSFPMLGKLRKGGCRKQRQKKDKSGKPVFDKDGQPVMIDIQGDDLNYFRLDSDRSPIVKAFEKHYGTEPTEIRVWLPYATPDENFPAFMEEWKGGGLQRRCTGEQIILEYNPSKGVFDRNEKPCSGQCACKPSGRLMVMVQELFKEGHVGFFTVETHSKNDILTLSANLQAAYALRPNLCGIPFILRRSPREISTPSGNGNRARRENWLLSIEPDAVWVQKQLSEMYREMMGSTPLSGTVSANLLLAEDDDDFETIGKVEPLPAKDRSELLKERFDRIRQHTGHTWKQIGTIINGLLRRDTRQEPPSDGEADQIRNDLLIDWAMGKHLTQEQALEALGRALAEQGSEDDEAIWGHFHATVTTFVREVQVEAVDVDAEDEYLQGRLVNSED